MELLTTPLSFKDLNFNSCCRNFIFTPSGEDKGGNVSLVDLFQPLLFLSTACSRCFCQLSTHAPHTVRDTRNVKRHINLTAFLAILSPSVTTSARGGNVQGEGGIDRNLLRARGGRRGGHVSLRKLRLWGEVSTHPNTGHVRKQESKLEKLIPW